MNENITAITDTLISVKDTLTTAAGSSDFTGTYLYFRQHNR
ncbi:MAG: hypothetical protein U5K00_18815 [Melioribacteraceae bacterium]|nr:hypothetical protein [Melioribacteraceae bacterium]